MAGDLHSWRAAIKIADVIIETEH